MFEQLRRPQPKAPSPERPAPLPLKPATEPAMPMPSVFTRPLERATQKKQRKACPACEEQGTTCPECQKKVAPALQRPPTGTQGRGGSPGEHPAERQADELGKEIADEIKGSETVGHGPLPKSVQHVAETHLGVSLEGTYVDAASAGQKKAKDESALAVTEGKNIAFGEGQLDTSSAEGRSLLGHELVHVGQQKVFGASSKQHAPGSTAVAKPPALPQFLRKYHAQIRQGLLASALPHAAKIASKVPWGSVSNRAHPLTKWLLVTNPDTGKKEYRIFAVDIAWVGSTTSFYVKPVPSSGTRGGRTLRQTTYQIMAGGNVGAYKISRRLDARLHGKDPYATEAYYAGAAIGHEFHHVLDLLSHDLEALGKTTLARRLTGKWPQALDKLRAYVASSPHYATDRLAIPAAARRALFLCTREFKCKQSPGRARKAADDSVEFLTTEWGTVQLELGRVGETTSVPSWSTYGRAVLARMTPNVVVPPDAQETVSQIEKKLVALTHAFFSKLGGDMNALEALCW